MEYSIDWIPAVPEEEQIVNDSVNATNLTDMESQVSFIHSGYAYAISGVFVWSALFLTSFQVREGRKCER